VSPGTLAFEIERSALSFISLIGDLTVYQNVELPLTYRNMPEADWKMRAQEALDQVGTSHGMKHFPSALGSEEWSRPK